MRAGRSPLQRQTVSKLENRQKSGDQRPLTAPRSCLGEPYSAKFFYSDNAEMSFDTVSRWSGLRPAALVGYFSRAASGPKPLSSKRWADAKRACRLVRIFPCQAKFCVSRPLRKTLGIRPNGCRRKKHSGLCSVANHVQ